MALLVKNLPANAGDVRDAGSIPGSDRSLGVGNGTLLQCSGLENPMNKGAWGVTKGQTWLSTHPYTVLLLLIVLWPSLLLTLPLQDGGGISFLSRKIKQMKSHVRVTRPLPLHLLLCLIWSGWEDASGSMVLLLAASDSTEAGSCLQTVRDLRGIKKKRQASCRVAGHAFHTRRNTCTGSSSPSVSVPRRRQDKFVGMPRWLHSEEPSC